MIYAIAIYIAAALGIPAYICMYAHNFKRTR
jgi:hypothetical protein